MTIKQFAEIGRKLIIILFIINILLIAAVGYLLKDKHDREQEELDKKICIEELIPISQLELK